MSRKFSNNEIKYAGKVLTHSGEYSPEELSQAQRVLTYWRTIHTYPINTFQATLRAKLSKLGYLDSLVAQRLKRSVSIVAKLNRFKHMKLTTMQDIAGLRAILKSVKQVRNLQNSYHQSRFKHILISEKDYIAHPAESGYRGIHMIYQYKNAKRSESDSLRIELQIRTRLQHNWATAVETMGTFLEYSLKSSEGPKKWLEYFALVSAGFAIREGGPVHNDFANYEARNLFDEIVSRSFKMKISEKLRGFTIAVDHIIQSNSNSKYNLLKLNIAKRVVTVKSYSANQYKQANIDYTSIEKEISKGAPIQAVLVSTDSIASLRKAYPNYFLDAQEFLDRLNTIYRILKRMDRR